MRNQFSHPCLFIKRDVSRQFMNRNATYFDYDRWLRMRLARMRYAADPSSTPDVRLLPVLGAIPQRLLYYREHSKQVTVANKASTTKNITHIYVSKAELLRGMVPECDSLPSIDYCWNREFIDELNAYSKDVALVSHATLEYA